MRAAGPGCGRGGEDLPWSRGGFVGVRSFLLVLLGTVLTRLDAERRRHEQSDLERLLARARDGDARAREQLVVQHMQLVRAVALRSRGLGLPFDDLVQEGAIGLLAAIDGFRPGRGAAFSTYAHVRIRNAITRALTGQGQTLRLPGSGVDAPHVLARAREREDAPVRLVSLDAALPAGTP